MEAKTSILVAVGYDDLCDDICAALRERGYLYAAVSNVHEFPHAVSSLQPNMAIVDIDHCDGNCAETIRQIRLRSVIPLLVVSCQCDETRKVEVLDAGADDYVTLPLCMGELLARIRATERRLAYMTPSNMTLSHCFVNGDLRIVFHCETVSIDGSEVHLTPHEYTLLCVLARQVGEVLSHQYILREIWGVAQEGDLALLRVLVGSLRKKIEPNPAHPSYIITKKGVGYRMARM